jgi:hypothetical protein
MKRKEEGAGSLESWAVKGATNPRSARCSGASRSEDKAQIISKNNMCHFCIKHTAGISSVTGKAQNQCQPDPSQSAIRSK